MPTADGGCRERLESQYQRLLLKRFNTRTVSDERSDDELRDHFREMLKLFHGRGVAPGTAATQEEFDEIVRTHRAGERPHQKVMDEFMDQVRPHLAKLVEQEAAAVSGTPNIFNTSACIAAFPFPGAAFNSVSMLTDEDDYVILVNLSLLELLWQAAKLIVWSTVLEDGQFGYRDNAKIGMFGRSPAEALAEIIVVYLGGPTLFAGVVELPKEHERTRHDLIYRACVGFVVGHELAHVLAGHLDGDVHPHRGKQEKGPLQGLNEGAADWLGVKLLLAEHRWGQFQDDAWRAKLQTLLAGPLLVTALVEVIEEAEKIIGKTPHETVAPPVVRRRGLEALYTELSGGSAFGDTFILTRDYQHWVYRIAAETLERVAEWAP